MTKECLQEALKTKSYNHELVESLMASFIPGYELYVEVFHNHQEFDEGISKTDPPCLTFDEYKDYVNQLVSDDCEATIVLRNGKTADWCKWICARGFVE